MSFCSSCCLLAFVLPIFFPFPKRLAATQTQPHKYYMYMFRLYKYRSAAVRDFTVKSASDGYIIKSLPVRCHTIYTERENYMPLRLLNAKTYSEIFSVCK